MKTLIRKFKAKTPAVYKRLQRFCIAMSAVSLVALQLKDNLPAEVQLSLPYMLSIGLLGTLFSQFTEEDKPKEDQ